MSSILIHTYTIQTKGNIIQTSRGHVLNVVFWVHCDVGLCVYLQWALFFTIVFGGFNYQPTTTIREITTKNNNK